MKWRDILIGAVVTLMVTVLGGVVVYYFTKEPDEIKSENLTYSINKNAQFSGGAQDFTFSSIEISNSGNVAASNVIIVVTSKLAEIRDLAITASEGLQEISRDRTPNGLRLTYKTLLPKESVTLNIILTAPEDIKADVRSDATLGKEVDRYVGSSDPARNKWNRIAELVVPGSGLVALLMLLAGVRLFRRSGMSLNSSRNNTGFLMLHSGLIAGAESIFWAAIKDGDCNPITLSNYALCKAALGEFEEAEKYIASANFIGSSGHAKAVVIFNQAIIHLLSGQKDEAANLLKNSINYSKKEIPRYCVHSKFLDEVRSDSAFSTLLLPS